MNHFDEILCEGQSGIRHSYQDNEELYDKSTNQSNLISATMEPTMNSPFDSSPKASLFFFSLNSPRQNIDNFQFNNNVGHLGKNSKDNLQSISRRLQFQEDQSLFCQQEELEQEQNSIKQEDPYNYSMSQQPQKMKKIKKSKNCKGLKNLSVGVYEIVTEKGHTTYKEVANTLIEKLKRKNKEQISQSVGNQNSKKVDKDQHNIKRRVYDALNVLISAQLLRKQGKNVIFNSKIKNQPKKFKNKQEFSRIHQSLKHEQNVLEIKRKQFQKLKLKYERIKNIMSRNKKLGLNYNKIIKLPFIVVQSNLQNIQQINMTKQDVQINFIGNALLRGDIDTLEQIEKPSHVNYLPNHLISKSYFK